MDYLVPMQGSLISEIRELSLVSLVYSRLHGRFEREQPTICKNRTVLRPLGCLCLYAI